MGRAKLLARTGHRDLPRRPVPGCRIRRWSRHRRR